MRDKHTLGVDLLGTPERLRACQCSGTWRVMDCVEKAEQLMILGLTPHKLPGFWRGWIHGKRVHQADAG